MHHDAGDLDVNRNTRSAIPGRGRASAQAWDSVRNQQRRGMVAGAGAMGDRLREEVRSAGRADGTGDPKRRASGREGPRDRAREKRLLACKQSFATARTRCTEEVATFRRRKSGGTGPVSTNGSVK